MDSFEVSVDGELFRISERREPGETLGYDFSWLNGPAEGTYGFSLGFVVADDNSTEAKPDSAAELPRDRLIAEVQGFVASFYEDGGIGQEEFPDHRADIRRITDA